MTKGATAKKHDSPIVSWCPEIENIHSTNSIGAPAAGTTAEDSSSTMVPTQSAKEASTQPATDAVKQLMPKPLAPLPAPTPPKPKVQMTMKIAANFSRLGLDDKEKNANFSRDFAVSMRTKLGGNNVLVNSVTAGDHDGFGDDVYDK